MGGGERCHDRRDQLGGAPTCIGEGTLGEGRTLAAAIQVAGSMDEIERERGEGGSGAAAVHGGRQPAARNREMVGGG